MEKDCLVVKKYYEALNGNFELFNEVLADELKFQGPVEKAESKQEFLGMMAAWGEKNPQIKCEIVPQEGLVGEGRRAVRFNFIVNGGDKVIPATDWHTIKDGKITSIECHHNPSVWAELAN